MLGRLAVVAAEYDGNWYDVVVVARGMNVIEDIVNSFRQLSNW
jgi:hypothetical protein